MHCRTVAVAVTGSWLQRLCGICPRAWLKDATPSYEPSSWCCRAWMNLAENRVSIYIYCYISIYIHTIILCAKVASQVMNNQLVADFGSVGPDPKIYEKKTTRLRWLEDSLHRELHHLLEGSKRDSPEMGISSQSICRLVWNPCARW